MSDWNFPGAKWWKFDFHTHTPASDDFKEREECPESWLRFFMDQEIDCVAITDHNTGAWVDTLKEALVELKIETPSWYRPIHLFPGVEISVNGGVHFLAIFDPDKKSGDIDSLLGAIGYSGTKGTGDGETKKSATEVIDAIVAHGGVAIPAHVDREKGLFQKLPEQKQVLENKNLYAIELCDKSFENPQLYKEKKLQWAEVRGSDTHSLNSNNANAGVFTWVKMEEPSIEGLRLALIDGSASISRETSAKPNEYAEFVIEEVEISQAQYMGQPNPLKCRFSPFLNAMIGGRGSGKSTLIEFMRLLLRRDGDVPASLQDDHRKYFQTSGDGLLTEESRLSLVYRKGDSRYRLNWAPNPDEASIQEWDAERETWNDAAGEIKSLFPVRIYSQKQIFELAKNPQTLLGTIDEDHDVDRDTFERERGYLTLKCKRIRQRSKQLRGRISLEGKIKGQLGETNRQIEQIEKSGHKAILQTYRIRQQQLSEIRYLEEYWQELSDKMAQTLGEAQKRAVNRELFENDPEILGDLEKKQKEWQEHFETIRKTLQELGQNLESWQDEKSNFSWMKQIRTDEQKYDQLELQLNEQKIDPRQYQQLLQSRALFQKQLDGMEGHKQEIQRLGTKYAYLLNQAKEVREGLTKKREEFLQKIGLEEDRISIEIKPFATPWERVEEEIRNVIQAEGRFHRDFEELQNVFEEEENGWAAVKERLREIRKANGWAKDARFQTHLRGLPTESIADLDLWFPEDDVKVRYYDEKAKKIKEISQGSPGQKSAALLTFILSYGKDPLLLDQPEDDLDNDLIYSLIVQRLKESKSRRQIIVVTHNANIVVNGDSEWVHALNVKNGQTHIEPTGSLQNSEVREQICETMEGGRKAFQQRYKRIHLEQA